MTDPKQLQRFRAGRGFIAALDQSGGSTPAALRSYGVAEADYSTTEQMFDLIHAARTRIITSPVFADERILGAILFQGTLDREIEGVGAAEYLWEKKGIIPFVKIDQGLADRVDDVQVMRDIPVLDDLLGRAAEQGVFGTKERSVIHAANPAGIGRIVDQQAEVGERVLAAGLVPILEPEVDISAPDKEAAETLLKERLLEQLPGFGDRSVALKVSIPSIDGFYADLVKHPNVARVVALSVATHGPRPPLAWPAIQGWSPASAGPCSTG